MSTHTSTHTHACERTFGRVHTHIHTHEHPSTPKHTHRHAHEHTFGQTHTQAHMGIHTQSHELASAQRNTHTPTNKAYSHYMFWGPTWVQAQKHTAMHRHKSAKAHSGCCAWHVAGPGTGLMLPVCVRSTVQHRQQRTCVLDEQEGGGEVGGTAVQRGQRDAMLSTCASRGRRMRTCTCVHTCCTVVACSQDMGACTCRGCLLQVACSEAAEGHGQKCRGCRRGAASAAARLQARACAGSSAA